MTALEKTSYGGWPNNVRLSNGRIEVVVTLDVGPRVMRLAVPGGRNLFKEFEDQLGTTHGTEWRIFGGHRLWHAPEVFPRTYATDFDPVSHDWNGRVLHLEQRTEPSTGIQKLIDIELRDNEVCVTHHLINRNVWAIEVSAWCLSVMAPGGRAIVPQEPFHPHPDVLHPSRPLVLWHFTRMNDPRFTWGDRFIQLREDGAVPAKEKFGARNSLGWAAYHLGNLLFIKTFACVPGATYPDMGCNVECYTQPGFLEVETLSPMTSLEPGMTLEHVEHWRVWSGIDLPPDEPDLATALDPYLAQLTFPTSSGRIGAGATS